MVQVRRGLAVLVGFVLAAGLLVVVDGHEPGVSTAATDSRSRTSADGDPGAWKIGPVRTGDTAVSMSDEQTTPPKVGPAAASAALQVFGSCDGLLTALRREGVERVTPWGLPATGGLVGVATAGQADGAAAAASADASGADGYSSTNVQEPGVDEPDVVKNNGERIVTLFDGRLRILERSGTEPVVSDTVDLETPSGAEMLMVGDHVVVLAPEPSHRWPATRVVTVDVADATDAVVTSDVTVDGRYVSSRSADGVVRVVVTSDGPSLTFAHPLSGDETDLAAALEQNREIVSTSSLEDWLPDVAPAAMGGCDGVFAPTKFSGFGTTTVLTLDPAAGELVDATSVTASASEVYASPEHLYIAAGVWPIDRGRGPDGEVTEVTEVHRFDVSDPRLARYEASGAVPGHLIRPSLGGGHLGQWALSEHDGDLRVATTTTATHERASISTVTVLRRDRATLTPIGAVTGLGPTEEIHAVRFMGERGYVVTYRRVDPLYVLDLADPREPRLLGELKVPGYSSYLHPIAEGKLLGIGQADPDEDGVVDGTQVSVFDVTDAARPRRAAHLRLGERGTISLAEGDHRALTWWADPARAILPLSDDRGFSGAVALDVASGSISEAGRIEHRFGRDEACAAEVVRSRVINGVVHTFSGAGVRTSDLDDFELRGRLDYDDAPACHPEPPPESPPSTTTTTTTTPGLIPDPLDR